MSDLLPETAPEAPIVPFAFAADGKLNSFTVSCVPMEQTMNYAACLWRQAVLQTPNVKTPADWAGCDKARRSGTCLAVQMRQEEELAGRSIYFRARGFIERIGSAAREWMAEAGSFQPSVRRLPASVPHVATVSFSRPKAPTAMLDAMGSIGDLSHAITAAAKTASAEPSLSAPAAPVPALLAGESPLQMARRIHAERAAERGAAEERAIAQAAAGETAP